MVLEESMVFFEKLKARLQLDLPQDSAFGKMSPLGRLLHKPNEKTRKSAILILFYHYQNELYIPLILRPKYDGVHGGQMAFPGGRMEKTDQSLIFTALREAQEEIGIKVHDVHILGQLTEIYIPPSNFLVQPVVGYLKYRPDFYPDEREVDKIFELSLTELSNQDNIKADKMMINGHLLDTAYYQLQDQKVWGATAMIIAELLEVIKSS